MAKSMFDIIKKQNGERFAKAIRNYDNGIFDIVNLDKLVKYAGRDAEPIMEYLVSLKNIQIEEQSVHMNPLELLSQAGYDAYIADTLEKQNEIERYYEPNEKLCTFRDPTRFERYYIINAVRKDVDKIKRSDFKKPQREDEYGTSVLSIQILKIGGFISIKNRYNHTVPNPDNTLNSNPDNIIPGLSDAIRHHFDVDFSSRHVNLPRGYTIVNNQIVRYDIERNNVYCAENFFVKDGVIHEIDKRSQIMLGNGLLLDLQKKEVSDITETPEEKNLRAIVVRDKFIESINEELANKKIQTTKNPLGGYDIVADGKVVLTIENGDLVYINLPHAKAIDLSDRKRLRGDLDFSGITDEINLRDANLSAVTSIKMPEQCNYFFANWTIFPAIDLDCSGITKTLALGYSDLSRITNITTPKSVDEAHFTSITFPEIDLDLSGIRIGLNLENSKMGKVKSIKPPKCSNITLTNTEFPSTILDLSGITGELRIAWSDLHNITGIIMPKNAYRLELGRVKLPEQQGLDLGCFCEGIVLSSLDMSKTPYVKLPKKIAEIAMHGITLPAIDFDCSGVTDELKVVASDITACKNFKAPTNVKKIYINDIKLPAADIDLSGATEELMINYSDITICKSIKMPKKVKRADLEFSKISGINLDLSGVTEELVLSAIDLTNVKSLRLPAPPTNIRILDYVKLPDPSKISYGPAIDVTESTKAEKFNMGVSNIKTIADTKPEDTQINTNQIIIPDQEKGI